MPVGKIDLALVPPTSAARTLVKMAGNIAQEPANPKFRKVRVLSPKFHGGVWAHLGARTVLVDAGFVLEERPDGPHLVLPPDVGPDAFQQAAADALVLCEARDNAHALLAAHAAE